MSSVLPFLLSDVLCVPSTKVPVDLAAFTCYILPPLVCYFLMALLALVPQTRAIRVASWPVVASLALRAALSVEMSRGRAEHKFFNISLVLSMVFIVARTLDWTLAENPLVRHANDDGSAPSIYTDALDLALNMRGLGWNWSPLGLHVPRETRPTTSRAAFAFCTSLSIVAHAWIGGTLHCTALSFAPDRGRVSTTIFDQSLPLVLRYLRSSVISLVIAFAIYAMLHASYDACVLPAVLAFGQDPARWPPAFDAPWRATSLSEFWGRRWHQWFRRTFLLLGGRPLSFLLCRRAGNVLGSFFASAAFHYVALATLAGGRAELWRMVLGFEMMALGILAERAVSRWTGRRVPSSSSSSSDGTVWWWVWTMGWMVLWGNVIVEGFARAGMVSCSSFVDLGALPVRVTIERLVASFDRWLHAI